MPRISFETFLYNKFKDMSMIMIITYYSSIYDLKTTNVQRAESTSYKWDDFRQDKWYLKRQTKYLSKNILGKFALAHGLGGR